LAWLVGGYDKPIKLGNTIKGFGIGTAIILVAYALVPEHLRFSRAIILLGAAAALVISIGMRIILHAAKVNGFALGAAHNKRFLIAGNYEESKRVAQLLEKTSIVPQSILFLSSLEEEKMYPEHFNGNLNQLEETIMIHKIDEIIFCAKDISSQKIIELMSNLVQTNVDFKIAPPESLFLVGSNSIDSAGDLYVIDINSIAKPQNRRNKRILDIAVSLIGLICSPVLVFVMEQKVGFIKNCFAVLFGVKSWVGYSTPKTTNAESVYKPLPVIKKGVLSPSYLHNNMGNNNKLNLLYSKDYKLWQDIKIIAHGIKKLGQS